MQDGDLSIRIGHSPDPDDAFMFHALSCGSFETPGRNYKHMLHDIETLNQYALEGKYEISAVSIHSFPSIADKYYLMNCGGSMGEGYGPMLISNSPLSIEEAKEKVIAIPGLGTSAYLALRIACGDVQTEVVPFDQIIPRVLKGEYDVGLIIHEGQLTWADEGVYMVLDLGVWWNEKTGLPLPLGGNVVRKNLGDMMCEQLTVDVRRAILHSLNNPQDALNFAQSWGRGIDEETNKNFVRMYVNRRTVDYGVDGRRAIRMFLKEGQDIGLITNELDCSNLKFIGAEVIVDD